MSVHVIKDFLPRESLEFFDLIFNEVESKKLWDSQIPYWNDRIYDLTNYIDHAQNIQGYKTVVKTIKKVKSQVCDSFGISNSIVCDSARLIKWSYGESQEPHYDNRPSDRAPWRAYSSILYLNSVDGGEIYFPELGLQYSAQAGQLIMFPSSKGYVHGVKPLVSPLRKTIAMFWTFDRAKDILGI
jgi:hypothetical protein